MIQAEQCFCDMNSSPVRYIRGRVETFRSPTTTLTPFKITDKLKSISIERVGESGKFFGFGIVQKANVKVIDEARQLYFTTANYLDIAFGVGCDFIYAFPYFKVSEVHRNENNNELSITAYDALYMANSYTVNDLVLPNEYTIEMLAASCANKLGLALNIAADGFDIFYESGANFDGSETLKEVLNAIAEATQTIYYLNNDMMLTFKRLDRDGEAVLTITKDKYFTLESGDNKRLATITNATELGENVFATTGKSGSTQYIRDNPLLEMRLDIDTLLFDAIEKIGDITINQFDCKWRGNFLAEIGDKIALTTKDDSIAYAYLLDDIITFDGTLSQETRWHYEDNEGESADNPATLGAALKQTYARVDKANKVIEIVAGDTQANKDNIAAIKLDTESITNTVSRIEKDTLVSLEDLNTEVSSIKKSVEAAITAEDVRFTIQEELQNGVESVTTSTGYTFNNEGLRISKTGSEMESLLDEDGLTVYRDNTEVLTADNSGVNGINMTVRQYLIVGGSRFEAYGGRTGCYWIG